MISEDRILLPSSNEQTIRRCPRCCSVFVLDECCESCGFQFNYNPLGEIFGAKSYFSLTDRYLSDLGQKSRFLRYLFWNHHQIWNRWITNLKRRRDIIGQSEISGEIGKELQLEQWFLRNELGGLFDRNTGYRDIAIESLGRILIWITLMVAVAVILFLGLVQLLF